MNGSLMEACSFNSPLSDEELYRALEENADQPILDHLENCHYCAMRLQEIDEAEMVLNRILHPRAFQLLNYQEDLLSPQEWQRIDFHVQSCKVCQEQLKTFDAIRKADEGISIEDQTVPRAKTESQQSSQVSRKPGMPIVASLIRPADAAQSLRVLGTTKANYSRRLQFKASTLNISLVIKREAGSIKLEGSISGSNDGWEESIVTLDSQQGESITTLGKQWKFSFGSVSSGPSEITIRSINLKRSLVISALEI